MHLSTIEKRAVVPFPEFRGERIYMEPVRDGKMPEKLARWAATLDAMLVGMGAPSLYYVMIDQQVLEAGQYHRRPGVHVDGYWGALGHGHKPRAGHSPEPGRHGSEPAAPPQKEHSPFPPTHRASPPPVEVPGWAPEPKWGSGSLSWGEATFKHPEALLLASDVSACRAFLGTCPGGVRDGGDCAHVDLTGMTVLQLDAGLCYAGNVGTLHESLPMPYDCKRTVVRLNVPGR